MARYLERNYQELVGEILPRNFYIGWENIPMPLIKNIKKYLKKEGINFRRVPLDAIPTLNDLNTQIKNGGSIEGLLIGIREPYSNIDFPQAVVWDGEGAIATAFIRYLIKTESIWKMAYGSQIRIKKEKKVLKKKRKIKKRPRRKNKAVRNGQGRPSRRR